MSQKTARRVGVQNHPILQRVISFLVKHKRSIGLLVFTLLYPATSYIVQHIPNPMLKQEGSFLALNMIFIVLAGYFYGPLSGAFAGSVGTALSAVLRQDMYDAVAILPHTFMGIGAGWAGDRRLPLLGGFSIIIGHFLNMTLYIGGEMVVIQPGEAGAITLGLATETMIDVVAIMLVITMFKKWLYHTQRW